MSFPLYLTQCFSQSFTHTFIHSLIISILICLYVYVFLFFFHSIFVCLSYTQTLTVQCVHTCLTIFYYYFGICTYVCKFLCLTSSLPLFLFISNFKFVFFHHPSRALPPVVNFINVKRTNFLYECCFSSFNYVHVTRKKLPKWRSYEKFVRRMLTKLTLVLHSPFYFPNFLNNIKLE